MSLRDALDLALAIERQVKEAHARVTLANGCYCVALSVGKSKIRIEKPGEFALLMALWQNKEASGKGQAVSLAQQVLSDDEEVLEAQEVYLAGTGEYSVAVTFMNVVDFGTIDGDKRIRRINRYQVEDIELEEDDTMLWGYIIENEGHWNLLRAIKTIPLEDAIGENDEDVPVQLPKARGRPKKSSAAKPMKQLDRPMKNTFDKWPVLRGGMIYWYWGCEK